MAARAHVKSCPPLAPPSAASSGHIVHAELSRSLWILLGALRLSSGRTEEGGM